jgi:3-deoxy-manno-octulosonate cytidylyltransferase (CMP-KDO synthetase)
VTKIAIVIPARLASTRFPRKVLLDILGMPMLEHVRRRALMCPNVRSVTVATCDVEIADYVTSNNGKVVMTSDIHKNGTSRVVEAIKQIDCTHVILLQGDEPLILPRHINFLANSIEDNPHIKAWNLVSSSVSASEIDKHSIVKCVVGNASSILYCFRRSPFYGDFNIYKSAVRKMLGVMAFEKNFLLELPNVQESSCDLSESIEQMKIIQNNLELRYLDVEPSLPSINEPAEVDAVLEFFSKDVEQIELFKKYS